MLRHLINLSPGLASTLALVLPFALSLILGPKLVAVLRAMKAGQPIREARKGVLAPEHQSKVGTPTMGGIMIIGLILLITLLAGDLTHPFVQCCLIVTAVTAFLGLMDDYAKITRHSTDGVSGWIKIALQFAAALGCSLYLYITCPSVSSIFIPFYGFLDIGIFFIPLALLVIIGSSNAVNLTDGLDGLASGCVAIAAVFLMLMADLLLFDNSALDPFMLSIPSACIGFLWFNCNPARMFMGDTGSLALGGALGTFAVCTGTELLLVLIGGIFVAEALSVIIQVMWFKYTRIKYGEGRRIFRMAPLHHHFEKGGLSETQVCVRFWIISLLLGLLSYWLLELTFSIS